MSKLTDIQVQQVSIDFEEYPYRTPLKFGGMVTTHTVLMNIAIQVKNKKGQTAAGLGSMPLGNAWSFPSKLVSFDDSLAAMKLLGKRMVERTSQCKNWGHPIDLMLQLESDFIQLAEAVTKQLNLSELIPRLCLLVTASPIDAALHDAFGKANGLNSYNGLGQDFMSHDLSHYLNADFKGEFLDRYTSRQPKPRMSLYHLIGALDPLTDTDIDKRINDGLPETLPEWIMADGLTHLKIKLNGDNLNWDVQRVCEVERVASEAQKKRGLDRWFYSLDFNEKCGSVEYLLEFLAQIQEKGGAAFRRVAYIEQPTARDLKANPENKMHKAAKIRPVVIDESLQDFESLLLARELGYSGVALKACKGQSQALLMAAAAQKYEMFLCVQDLTCPGASFLHSAGLAARVPTVTAIEGNARQYCPKANEKWAERYPELFQVKAGTIGTGCLTENGLGH